MMQLAREQAERLILRAWNKVAEDGSLPGSAPSLPAVEIPGDDAHGDLTCAFCLAAAGCVGMDSRALADLLCRRMGDKGEYLSAVEAAGPGYLNFRLGDKWYTDALRAAAETARRRGRSNRWAAPAPTVEGPDWADTLRRHFLGQALDNILDRTGDAFVCITEDRDYVNRQEAAAGSCRILRSGVPVETPPPADRVPLDALRFLLSARLDRSVTVDLDLAAREDGANPYYRVRYARDRMARVLGRYAVPSPADADLSAPQEDEERALVRLLCRWEGAVGRAARTADPGTITAYLTELADRFWARHRELLSPEAAPARLVLADTVRLVLEDGLGLLGITI